MKPIENMLGTMTIDELLNETDTIITKGGEHHLKKLELIIDVIKRSNLSGDQIEKFKNIKNYYKNMIDSKKENK